MSEVHLGLLHGRDVEKHERLAQMVIGTETSDRARQGTDDRAGLSVQHALPVISGANVQGVLERGLNGAIVLGRHEQNRVRARDAIAKLRPLGRRLVVQVLIVKLQLPDLEDTDSISAFATMRLIEPLRRLPTITVTSMDWV